MINKKQVTAIRRMENLEVKVGDWVASIFSGWVRVAVVTKHEIITEDKVVYLRTGQLMKNDFARSLFTNLPVELGFEEKPADKLRVKGQKDLQRQLVDDGYLIDTNGIVWRCPGKRDFGTYMFKYCNEYQPDECVWEPEWLQEGRSEAIDNKS